MSERKIVLIGYSGHGLVVAETAIQTKMSLQYYTEKQIMQLNPYHLDYLGFEKDVNFAGWKGPYDFILGIGNNKIRADIAKHIISKGGKLLNVINDSASVSKNIKIGQGNFIAKHSVVNPLASIGNFCILNTGCIVEHECSIADGVHIAPGSVLLGNVSIGNNTFIGANTVVKEGISIGCNVIVGAGSVIIKDVPDHSKIVGNPGRII